MKPSEILRVAARRVERHHTFAGCLAINGVRAPVALIAAAHEYFQRVAPSDFTRRDFWWGSDYTFADPPAMGARIVGLCLAAAIAESEGQ